MLFTDIRLQNYRSYKDSSFELNSGVTMIVGPNGAGKSNLIEAVMAAANSLFYRGKIGVINHEADWARIDVHTKDNTTRTLKLKRRQDNDSPQTEFVINDKAYKRLPAAQKQPAVLFEPNNLLLLHGEPSARRDYLDNLSSGIDESFEKTLRSYRRILAQRNSLLKQASLDKSQLFVWNVRLCETAETIVSQRLKTIELIQSNLSQTYSKISDRKTRLVLSYKTPINTKNYTAGLLKKLETDLEVDRARGFTGSGPHREDFSIDLNGQPVPRVASRGETRTLVLALKIIELELLQKKTKNRPLLFLDDVFSELDNSRRRALTSFLEDYQTIITTTDAEVVLKNFTQNCQIIPLKTT